MNISAINSSSPLSSPKITQSANADGQIRALEQQLQKLNTEKQKAIQSKDEEQKKKIERQIQEIKKQIQQLRQQEKEKEAVPNASEGRKTAEPSPDIGKYIDVYA